MAAGVSVAGDVPMTSGEWNGIFGSGLELETVGGKEMDPMIISLMRGYVQNRSDQQGVAFIEPCILCLFEFYSFKMIK